MSEVPKYLKIENNLLVLDKEALAADGVTDYFTLPQDVLAPITTFYTDAVARVNAGDASLAVSCEVSDFAARAKCLLTIE